MAYARESIVNPMTYISAEDLSAKENHVVTHDGAGSDGYVQLQDARAEVPCGVVLDGGEAAGDQVLVSGEGSIVMVKAGDTCTRGKSAMCDTGAEGRVMDAAGGSAGLVGCIGSFLASGVDGDLVAIRQHVHVLYYAA